MCVGNAKDKSIYKYQIIDIFVESKAEMIGFENENIVLSCDLKDKFSNITWTKSNSVKYSK